MLEDTSRKTGHFSARRSLQLCEITFRLLCISLIPNVWKIKHELQQEAETEDVNAGKCAVFWRDLQSGWIIHHARLLHWSPLNHFSFHVPKQAKFGCQTVISHQ